ncbi:Mismatch repair protein msh3 [Gaertneriomyces sp. JEL0708]|nr:Mismatch repair protein msh3 [Gaertneriomyces sp. JEL0708]
MSGAKRTNGASGRYSRNSRDSNKQQRTISSFFTLNAALQPPSTIVDSPVATNPTPASSTIEANAARSLGSPGRPRTTSTGSEAVAFSPPPKIPRSRSAKRIVLSDDEEESTNAELLKPTKRRKTGQSATVTLNSFKYNTQTDATAADPLEAHRSKHTNTPESDDRKLLREKFARKFTLKETSAREAPVAQENQSNESEETFDQASSPNLNTFRHKGATPKEPARRGKAASKYTPLEQQYLDIKGQNPDCLLIVEVGYKFRFFEDDAKIAAKELNIVAYMDHSMYTASIPTHRLHVHVKKLVQNGYKVGVVRQMETAALKAVGDNKSGPFVRKLTNVYTKGTFIDDDVDDVRASYLLCINEEESNTGGVSAVAFSLVAVNLHTGDVVFDEFNDNHMRNELETRLVHFQPTEILLPAEPLTDMTEKLIKHLYRFGAATDIVRIERLTEAFVDHSHARRILAEFYEKPLIEGTVSPEDTSSTAELYSQAMTLPRPVLTCLAALVKYLGRFQLENVLRLTKLFSPFSSVATMILNADTLRSLEIYNNSADGEEKNSLFAVINHTKTKFGRRLLRKWVGKPLVQIAQLKERVDAVHELIKEELNGQAAVHKIKGVIAQLPDLEKSICRIYYGRSSPSEVYSTLVAFDKITSTITPGTEAQFTSPLLRKIFGSLPAMKKDVLRFRSLINESAAKENDKINVFSNDSEWDGIAHYKEGIRDVEAALDAHLHDIRKEVKKPSLTYVTVAGIPYLIEVPVSQASKVPRDWVKISSTKSVARFHSSVITEKIKERDRCREQLQAACDAAYKQFLGQIASRYETVRDIVQNIGVIDCLLSLAVVASQPGYCKPEFVQESIVQVKQGRHPIGETLVSSYVANDIDLRPDRSCLLITGPNMGGKSSYIRQVALTVVLGQIGSYVPAESARIGIFDCVFTRMGASDDMAGGRSTFMKELQETSDIIRSATCRSLVILDELGRGTSTHDGTAIAYATLRYFLESVKCFTLFVTHYPMLGRLEMEHPSLTNAHMAFYETATEENTIVFLYKLTAGLANKSYGLNVAKLADLPEGILKVAREKASILEQTIKQRKQATQRQKISKVVHAIRNGQGTDVNFLKLIGMSPSNE